jgi:hypothetical protein
VPAVVVEQDGSKLRAGAAFMAAAFEVVSILQNEDANVRLIGAIPLE